MCSSLSVLFFFSSPFFFIYFIFYFFDVTSRLIIIVDVIIINIFKIGGTKSWLLMWSTVRQPIDERNQEKAALQDEH